MPVQGPQQTFTAKRPHVAAAQHANTAVGRGANPWRLQATLPGAVVHDLAFPTAQVGYAAAELGQVWKTSDGGENWTKIVDVGFPKYWYGVHALNENDIVISGFDNQAFTGVIRWSHDGGATWTDDIVLLNMGWSSRVRFADDDVGVVMDLLNFNEANSAHYTTNGGLAAADWATSVPDPLGGWFGNQFSLLANGRVRASGVTYCDSANAGAAWSCRPSVDPVFDGPVHFFDEANGWVGGGSIDPVVAGWLHRTTDGGATWSGRTLESAWPVREIHFMSAQIGWAVGGNIYSNVGGIQFTNDGGETWAPDFDSNGHELHACAHVGQKVWCAGFNGAFNGAVYTLDLVAPTAVVSPGALNFSVREDEAESAPLTIANIGTGALTYAIEEANVASTTVQLHATSSAAAGGAGHVLHSIGTGHIGGPRDAAPWAPRTTEGALSFVLDDGTYENNIGLNDQLSTESAGIWLNRFALAPGTGAFTIDSISILWPQNTNGSLVGKQVNLVAYHDADADGNPRNAVRLGADTFHVIDSLDTFINYAVNFAVPGAGDIYIGFENSYARGGSSPILFPASIDQSSATQGNSWVIAGDIDPDLNNLGGNTLVGVIDTFGLPGNWLIRGTGVEGGAGSGCSSPTDVPWLGAAPASGSVEPGTSQVVTVTVNATGLDAGSYSALLCITTNDAANSLVQVPVSLTIGDKIFADGFEETP